MIRPLAGRVDAGGIAEDDQVLPQRRVIVPMRRHQEERRAQKDQHAKGQDPFDVPFLEKTVEKPDDERRRLRWTAHGDSLAALRKETQRRAQEQYKRNAARTKTE